MGSTTGLMGEAAERSAEELLEKKGYRILTRNYRCRHGEIDIVAEDNDVLVFVEVRSRRTDQFGDPLETVDIVKQTRITRTARHYLSTQKKPDRSVRFDVIGIVNEPSIRVTLVRGAFESDT